MESDITPLSDSTPLSKNQQKKLKKREKWLQVKADKRASEKKNRKRRFAELREKGELVGPTRKSLKKREMKDSKCQVRVVIDCSFDDMMTDKDIIHLTQQLQHSYAANRRAEHSLQFYVSGINGKLKQRLEGIGDYKGWDIYMKGEDYLTLFNKEDIVYLSSESPNILSTVTKDKVYIIGGLVDHNHHKGYCYDLAQEKGVQHAQLPIGQYIDMKARKVLTINHVFEILLRYTECENWQKAFYSVLPQRKGAKYKTKGAGTSSNNSDTDIVQKTEHNIHVEDSSKNNDKNDDENDDHTVDHKTDDHKNDDNNDQNNDDNNDDHTADLNDDNNDDHTADLNDDNNDDHTAVLNNDNNDDHNDDQNDDRNNDHKNDDRNNDHKNDDHNNDATS